MSEPYGYTIFCDDIREEVGSKLSFMGTYNGSMSVQSATPVALPKLALAMTLVLPGGMDVKKVEFAVKRETDGQEEEEIFRANLQEDVPTVAADRIMRVGMNFQMTPFLVNGSFLLKARAYVDGAEIKLGTMQVELVSPKVLPTAV